MRYPRSEDKPASSDRLAEFFPPEPTQACNSQQLLTGISASTQIYLLSAECRRVCDICLSVTVRPGVGPLKLAAIEGLDRRGREASRVNYEPAEARRQVFPDWMNCDNSARSSQGSDEIGAERAPDSQSGREKSRANFSA
jgi:hypothetical protein